MLNGSAGRI